MTDYNNPTDEMSISFYKETEPKTVITFSVDSDGEREESHIYNVVGVCLGSVELAEIETSLDEAINTGELKNDIDPYEDYTCSILRATKNLYYTKYIFLNLQKLEVLDEN